MIILNHQHLYYFWVVAKEGSVARACEKLFLAQPTVSGQIIQLEKFFGRRLFTRDKKKMDLTDDGKLVFEQYFAGYDEPWGQGGGQHAFDATTKHDMRSVSKSVISLLVGIAIDRKLIASADEPVVKFYPEYSYLKSPGWDQVTLRHLLTMSSGMQWDENRAWNDPKNDDQSMAERVIELLDNPARRQTIGAAARAMVEKRHDWNSLVQTMEQFYETNLLTARSNI